MSDRIKKINELIKQKLNSLIIKEVEFSKDALVTITHVDTSKDLRHSNIYVSVLPKILAKESIDALYKASLHSILYKKLTIKPLPKLHYRLDKTEEKASEIERLLDQIKNNG